MTRFILRTVLTTLALVTMFAGSFTVNRTSANAGGDDTVTFDYTGDSAAPSKCQELAGCPGGPITCGTIILDDGTIVKCGMR